MHLGNLRDLYIEQLKDLYSAEQQLTEALPKMANAAHNPELKSAFQMHLEVTKNQIERLDQIFKDLNESPGGKHCKGMEGLIKESEELLKKHKDADPHVLDAALITAAQRAEHYEIAGYGTVATYAERLGENKALPLLQKTLGEEEHADQKLTELAETGVNAMATT